MELKLYSGIIEGDPNPWDKEPYNYVLKLTVEKGDPEVEIKVAISHSSSLDMFTKKTPIEYSFTASKYYAFYESLSRESKVIAELYSNEIGGFRKTSGHSGSSGRGKFIRDPFAKIDLCGGDSI